MENLDAQRQEWNGVATGWEKYDDWLDQSYRNFNEILLDRAGVAEGHFVADLGCGTGHPAIQAAQRVGRTGHVVGIDFANEMVELARKKAVSLGLINVGFRVGDVTKLLFADVGLDAVTARFSLMFFPNPEKTIQEAFRILKRGGRFAAAVWGAPEKNPLPMFILKDYLEIPPPDPSAPGAYRFAQPGLLKGMLEKAGFVETTEEEVAVEEAFPTGREYVDHFFAMAAPVQPQLRQLTEEKRREIYERLSAAAEEYRKGDKVAVPRVALIVSGKKPPKQ